MDDMSMPISWGDADLSSRPRMPIFILPLVFAVSIGTLMLSPSRLRKFVALPVIIGTMLALPLSSTGNIVVDYDCMTVTWMVLLKYLELVVLSNPEDDFRKVRKKWMEDDEKIEGEVKPDDFVGRLKWSASLFFNFRGVGWSWSIKNVPDAGPQAASRSLFLTETLFRICFAVLGAIFTSSILLSTPFYSPAAPPRPSLHASPYPTRALVSLSSALVIAFGMLATFSSFALASTALHLSAPADWPPLMRSPAEAYSVRRLWGTTYHQLFRRSFTVLGAAAARRLHARPASLPARLVHLATAFLLSAALHHAAGVMIGHGSMGVYAFFLSQIAAIVLEDAVAAAAAFLGYALEARARAAGYVWVLAWLSVSMTPFAEGLIASGHGLCMAQMSNLSVDGALRLAGGLVGGDLWWGVVRRAVLYMTAVAAVSVVRKMVIPGRVLVDWSLLGL